MVTNDSFLGDLTAASDTDVVAKASSLVVNVIAIVRLAPPKGDVTTALARPVRWTLLLGAVCIAACHPDGGPVDGGASRDGGGRVDGGACAGGYLNSDAANACPLVCSPAVQSVADEGAEHIDACTPHAYLHDPPASGSHWPSPAPWGVHGEVVPRAWWVHNLEHGGVVLLFNCPGGDGGVPAVSCDGGFTPPSPNGCPEEIAKLSALYAQHPPDVWSPTFSETRILVTGDPQLPRRFGAVAWDWVFLSDTLDDAALQCFIDARYGRGPENAP